MARTVHLFVIRAAGAKEIGLKLAGWSHDRRGGEHNEFLVR